MDLVWNKQMSVGNELIDSEHMALHDMMAGIERAIKARDAASLLALFKLFEEAVRTHFRHEAMIAQAINYDFEEHRLEHHYVLNEMQTMKDELLSIEKRWSESAVEHYFGFLSQWTIYHINEDDMRMKATLETYPYNFKPPAL